MQTAAVDEISLHDCKEKFKDYTNSGINVRNGLTKNILCAHRDGIDTCQGLILISSRIKNLIKKILSGDSGSGIMKIFNSQYHVIGITSFGLGCGSKVPSFYTRVSEYLPWIESIVWPKNS